MAKKSYIGISTGQISVAKQIKKGYIGVANPNFHNLPNEYQEVEYIESTGTQYIDTKYIANETTIYETKASFVTQTSNCAEGYSNNLFVGIKSSGKFYQQSGFTSSVETKTNDNLPHIFKCDIKNKIAYCDEYSYTNTASAYSYTKSMFLFGARYLVSPYDSRYKTTQKKYWAKIWDDETLVRYFVPCYRKSDNVAGMYDLVNNEFYTNSGTGTFGVGADIKESVAKQIKKGYIGIENPNYHNLPSGYQEVEYIESTGTQYIDTGYHPSSRTKIEIDVYLITLVTQNYHFLGCRDNNVAADGYALGYNKNTILSDYFGSRVSGTAIQSSTWIKVVKNKNIVSFGDQILENRESESGATHYSLYLLGIQGPVTAIYKGIIRIRNIIISEDNTVKHHYIPCYRKSDNVAGLYDLANDIFYTNQGTGTFTVGQDVKQSLARLIFEQELANRLITSDSLVFKTSNNENFILMEE